MLNRTLSYALGLSCIIGALAFGTVVQATMIYSVDDGTSETSVGHGASGDFLWGNYFTEAPGGTIITEIQIAFGNSGVGVGTPFEALIFEDLDDDGDPTTNLTLLTRFNSAVQNPQASPGSMLFETHDVPDTIISGGFFIAVFMAGTTNPFPAPFDQTSDAGIGWFAEHDVIGGLDTNDPFGTATLSGQPGSFGLPGNFMVRTVATPEPGTAVSLGLGLVVLAVRQRRVAHLRVRALA